VAAESAYLALLLVTEGYRIEDSWRELLLPPICLSCTYSPKCSRAVWSPRCKVSWACQALDNCISDLQAVSSTPLGYLVAFAVGTVRLARESIWSMAYTQVNLIHIAFQINWQRYSPQVHGLMSLVNSSSDYYCMLVILLPPMVSSSKFGICS
jgi:hypothetical protein